MDKALRFLQVNALALLCWAVAFFFWKDYLTHPHQRVTVEGLAHTTGPLHRLDSMVSLPSGSRSGYWLMMESPRRDFNVSLGLNIREASDELREGTEVTVGYSPEVEPEASTADAFSLKRGDKEYLSPELQVKSYNDALDRKQRMAIYTTVGGFVALGLVELIRRKLRGRKAD